MRFFKFFIFLMLTLSTSGCLFFMGAHAYHEEYGEAGDRVQRILVDRGICKSMQRTSDCEFYFVGSTLGGFDFTVYGITDPAVLTDIKHAVQTVFNENVNLTRVSLSAWKYPHHTNVGIQTVIIKQPDPPIMHAVFQR